MILTNHKSVLMLISGTLFLSVGQLRAETSQLRPAAPQVLFHGLSNPQIEGSQTGLGLDLTSLEDLNAEPIEIRVKKMLRAQGLPEAVRILNNHKSTFNLLSSEAIISDTFTFSANGIPFCNAVIRTHQTPIGRMSVMGSMPRGEIAPDLGMNDFPLAEDAQWLIKSALSEKYNRPAKDFRVISKEACLWAGEDTIVPVWSFRFAGAGLEFQASASDRFVIEVIPQAFHVDGTAKVYPGNPLAGQTKSFKLSGLKGNGYLENDYFRVVTQSGLSQDLAHSPSNEFLFPEMSSEFIQTSLFVNANRMLGWLASVGYKNFGSRKINIIAHRVYPTADGRTDINNATYEISESGPTISIADGDGLGLQNLPVDFDVVSHEFGHHVLFHTVTQIAGESLVLHEAIADFLTFAQTGDPCLGESICPADSDLGYCVIKGQCLRTADNEYRFDQNPPETRLPHRRSQFFSGFLWDLIKKDGIESQTLAKMTLGAIDLLVPNSGYQHMVLGLLIVDDAEYGGQYCGKIYDRAVQRGMESLVKGLSCDVLSSLIEDSGSSTSQRPNVTAILEGVEPTSSASSEPRSSSGGSWCGSTGAGSAGPLSLVALLISPLLLFIRRKKAAVVIKST